MKKLYESTKQIILSNYNKQLDEQVLEYLTVATIALFIRFPEITKQKLPSILNKLEIFFQNKSIIEMVTEKYPNYPKNEITKTTNAFVLRALNTEDENNIEEEWTMYISTSDINNKQVTLISKCVHELIHLLRFNGILNKDKEVKIKDGISIARYNKETKTLKRKYYNIEEGIVEQFTIEAMESLYEFIKNEDVSFSPILSKFKAKFKKEYNPSYDVERFFINGLIKDQKFYSLLEYSFIDLNETPELITYYNTVMGNATAFSSLSRDLETILEIASRNDINNFNSKTKQLINTINEFLAKSNKRKRK